MLSCVTSAYSLLLYRQCVTFVANLIYLYITIYYYRRPCIVVADGAGAGRWRPVF